MEAWILCVCYIWYSFSSIKDVVFNMLLEELTDTCQSLLDPLNPITPPLPPDLSYKSFPLAHSLPITRRISLFHFTLRWSSSTLR
ncbi:hypothetical protein L1987_14446 [Smallanthus sonchifolius]|uniref:Uncharacterized protein n=1 Tax=Smallanthus sonchifolius TaxID=185202 RepID=A0ACB9J517_9ASTR|nr:hypothetical protein L1987_14446 [Smallanthus sonchifolius]